MRTDLNKQAAACRQKAAECERRAVLAKDQTHRRTYLELAQLWREMAAHGDRLNDLFAQAKPGEGVLPKRSFEK